MNILKRHIFREEATGTIDAQSAKKMSELLDMTDEELVRYGNPPTSIAAEFKDGDGHVYRGTLYLVNETMITD